MAKNSRYDTARLASTVNGRYQADGSLHEGFFLDGRLPGKRDQYRADVTTDREDKGFLFALYGTRDGEWSDNDAAPTALSNLLDAVKNGNQDIDAEINDLADCAIAVTGRATLSNNRSKAPYFAGVLVKEKETAAVVTGNAIAMLYRDDMLYPLNDSSYTFDDTDYNGNRIAGVNDYIAGLAGSIKYSNIAELQQNDCIILTTTEIVEAVGQKELLRLLHEAEDQADAADMIIEAASEKLPDAALQIMISFVEYIIPASKTGKLNLNVFSNNSDEAGEKTTLYQPINSKTIEEYQQSTVDKSSERHFGNVNESEDVRTDEEVKEFDRPEVDAAANLYKQDLLGDDSEQISEGHGPGEDDVHEAEHSQEDSFARPDHSAEEYVDEYNSDDDFVEPEHEHEHDAFAPTSEAEYEEYNNFDEYSEYSDDQENYEYDDADYNYDYDEVDYNDYDQSNDDFYSGYGNYEGDDEYQSKTFNGDEYDNPDYDPYAIDNKDSNVKRYIMYAALALVCVLCILALYKMISSGGSTSETTTTTPTTTLPFINPEKQTVTTTTTTKSTTTTTATTTTTKATEQNNAPAQGNEGGNADSHVQPQEGNSVGYNVTVPGDSDMYLYDLAIQYYDYVDDETINRIKEANGLQDNVLSPGTTIYLP